MTLRGVVFAWIAAIAIACAASVVAVVINQNRSAERLAEADVVFLGSSLTRNALPDHGTTRPLPEIGTDAALRFGMSRGSEREFLALARLAVQAEVGTIFIEVNPVISRLAHDPIGCGLRSRLVFWHKTVRQAAQFVVQMDDLGAAKAFGVDQRQAVDPDAIDRLYPMRREGPCEREAWASLVANAPDTQIIFLELPRDQVAHDLIGAQTLANFAQAADELAAELEIPVFRPNAFGAWDTTSFVDHSHLNDKGADRFRAELAAWWNSSK